MSIDIPTGWAQVTLGWSGPTDTGKAATVLAFNVETFDTFAEVAASVAAAFGSHLIPLLDSSWTCNSITVMDNTFAFTQTYALTGTRSGDCPPPSVAVLVKKIGAERGRANRGRNYWPGFVHSGDLDESGYIDAGWFASLSNAFYDFGAAIATDGATPVILHNDPELPPTAVIAGSVEQKVATQRRRLR
jgi:hypothetical protein